MAYKMKSDERKRSRRYYKENKEKIKASVKRYREENKEKVVASKKKYRQENKEILKKKDAAYYQVNREQVRKQANGYTASHTEANRARAAAWYKEHPERGKANAKVAGHRRRARKASVGGKFTKVDIQNMYVSQGAHCYYCSVSIEEAYHIEHMTPISRGGSNWIDNICLACVPCNRTKGVKTAEEFMNVK